MIQFKSGCFFMYFQIRSFSFISFLRLRSAPESLLGYRAPQILIKNEESIGNQTRRKAFCYCTTCIVYVILSKNASFIFALFSKAGAKVRSLKVTTKCFRKFFFSLFFQRGISERNKPQAEEICKSSYAVPVRMSKHRCFRSRKRVQK